MKRIYLLFILFFTVGCFSMVYTQSLEQYLTAADTSFKKKDYYSALNYYNIANEIQEYQDPAIWYKYAEAARLMQAYTQADTAYQSVLELSTVQEYPLALYWLADTKRYLGKYQQAKSIYERFVTESPLAKGYYLNVAEAAIAQSDWAIQMTDAPTDSEVEHLSPRINTGYSEFAPIPRGDTLYYSSLSSYDEGDTYNPPRAFAKMMVAVGDQAAELQADFNAPLQHSAHHAFDESGTTIYYTICAYVTESVEVRCQLYSRTQTDGQWSQPSPLPTYINQQGYTHTQPSVGSDRNTGKQYLYYISDRPDGQGGLDIWCSEIEEGGRVLEPVNLETINTPQDEMSPFFHNRTQALYFSSNGHRSLGGYDIFKSTHVDENQFDTPQNIGAPINGSYNDIYFALDNAGTMAYFASNRATGNYLEADSEICCNDIYRVEMRLVVDST
ncbi:MAG: tetratricopeptide repeat protein, partial [Bacteroidota bacterium]